MFLDKNIYSSHGSHLCNHFHKNLRRLSHNLVCILHGMYLNTLHNRRSMT